METIAAFDFDGTITRNDTLIGMIVSAVGWGGLAWRAVLLSPYIVGYKLGVYSNSKAKERLFGSVFGGMEISQFDSLCRKYMTDNYDRIVRAGAIDAIRRHKAEGHRVAIVSASIDNWVAPFAERLGADMVIGTRIEIGSDGRLTGRFATPNCYGSEKVRRLGQAFGNIGDINLIAYGDSGGDRQMLAAAREAYYKPFRDK